jgi:xylulokinase
MKPLRPCIIWADRRATDECRWVRDNVGEDEIFKVTGNVIDPYYGYIKMLWIKRNEPKIWKSIHKIMTPNAYCVHKLTGAVSIDLSSAGNYGGIFDIHRKAWSDGMMKALGIPATVLPEKISMSKDVVGEITPKGSELTGLRRGTPISAGGIDAPVSALAVGALEDGDLALMLGTSMCCGFISHKPRLSPKLINYPYVVRDMELTYSFAGLTTAGYCIRWFRDQLGKAEVSAAGQVELSPYGILDMEAEGVPPGSEGLIFMPHMMVGERAPYWDDDVRGCIAGLTVYHTRAHLFRAFLEGVTYGLRFSVETAQEAGMPLRRILLVDGGAKSRLWRSILTDVTGLTMAYISQNPGAPLGDALLAGLGAGVIRNPKAVNEWLDVTEVTKPNSSNKELYDRYYKLYLKLYKANEGVFRDMRRLTR